MLVNTSVSFFAGFVPMFPLFAIVWVPGVFGGYF